MMGDLVLLEDGVNPVLSALLQNGLEVTALHDQFFSASHLLYACPRTRTRCGSCCQGKAGAGFDWPANSPAPEYGHWRPLLRHNGGTLDTALIKRVVGHKGEQNGPVYKITIGRDDLHLTEMGAKINARMGLNTWAAFYGSNANTQIAGDVAMLASEMTAVLKALRSNGLNVVSLHNHMTSGDPSVYFVHYWGTGSVEKLAQAFKSVIGEVNKKRTGVAAVR